MFGDPTPEEAAAFGDAFISAYWLAYRSRRLLQYSGARPEAMWMAAREKGLPANANTRGFVFNADLDSVIRSLDIGTRVDLNRGRR